MDIQAFFKSQTPQAVERLVLDTVYPEENKKTPPAQIEAFTAALRLAAERDAAAAFAAIVACKPSKGSTTNAALMLFSWAIRQGEVTVIKAFLRAGLKPDVDLGYGQYPALVAIKAKKLDSLQIILHAGAGKSIRKTGDAVRLVKEAAGINDPGYLQSLLDHGVAADFAGSKDAAVAAATAGADRVIEFLLGQGWRPDVDAERCLALSFSQDDSPEGARCTRLIAERLAGHPLRQKALNNALERACGYWRPSARIIKTLWELGADPRSNAYLLQNPISRQAVDAVLALLGAGADPNGATRPSPKDVQAYAQWNAWPSPVRKAVELGNLEIVRLLVEAGADVSEPDAKGARPLDIAIVKGHSQIADFLRRRMESSTGKKSQTSADLCAAAEEGNLEKVRSLLDAGVAVDGRSAQVSDMARSRYDGGMTPLMHAARAGHVHVMKRLVDAGADIAARTIHDHAAGQTALSIAARAGRIDAVRWLLGRGAKVNDVDEGREFLGQNRLSVLAHAIESDCAEVVAALIEAGADPGAKSNGLPPLLIAARKGKLESARALLSKGAKVDQIDSEGHTALLEAIGGSRLEIVELLLRFGADIRWSSKAGLRPIHRAIEAWGIAKATSQKLPEARRIVELLVESGADVNVVDFRQKPVLFESVRDPAMFGYLIDKDADSRIRSIEGSTLLHAMIRSSCDPASIEYLVKSGLDVNAADRDGKTALDLALSLERDPIVVGILRDAGAIQAHDLPPASSKAPVESREPRWLKKPRLAHRVNSPGFRQAVATVQRIVGVEPEPKWNKAFKVEPAVFFEIPLRDAAGLRPRLAECRDGLAKNQAAAMASGFRNFFLIAVVPTAERDEMLALFKTGSHQGLPVGSADIAGYFDELEEMEAGGPVRLVGLSPAHFEFEFAGPVKSPGAIAKRLLEMFPVLWGDDSKSPREAGAKLAKRIRAGESVHVSFDD